MSLLWGACAGDSEPTSSHETGSRRVRASSGDTPCSKRARVLTRTRVKGERVARCRVLRCRSCSGLAALRGEEHEITSVAHSAPLSSDGVAWSGVVYVPRRSAATIVDVDRRSPGEILRVGDLPGALGAYGHFVAPSSPPLCRSALMGVRGGCSTGRATARSLGRGSFESHPGLGVAPKYMFRDPSCRDGCLTGDGQPRVRMHAQATPAQALCCVGGSAHLRSRPCRANVVFFVVEPPLPPQITARHVPRCWRWS